MDIKDECKYFGLTNDERSELLEKPYEERMEITREIIKTVVSADIPKVIQFSGGVDSIFMLSLVHEYDDTIPALFMDLGLFLDDQEEFALEFFDKYDVNYVIARSGYDWKSFVKEHGFPVFKGFRPWLSTSEYERYNITTECRKLRRICFRRFRKKVDIGFHYSLCGSIADESPQAKTFFKRFGFVNKPRSHSRLIKPIQLIKKDEIIQYLIDNDIMFPRDVYQIDENLKGSGIETVTCKIDGKEVTMGNSGYACFMCGTRFNTDDYGRFGRIARREKELYDELLGMGLLETFLKVISDYPEKGKYIMEFLKEYPASYKDRIESIEKDVYGGKI